jgi:hypothetical protein
MVTRLTTRYSAIVTTETGTDDFTVIQRRNKWQPAIWRHTMTGVTVIGCIRMVARFTLRDNVVMTAGASTDNFIVIQWRYKRCPRS